VFFKHPVSTIANLFFNLGHMSAEIDFGRYLIFFKTPNVMKFCIVRPHPNPISADPMLLRTTVSPLMMPWLH
jgi:hypothetical protein